MTVFSNREDQGMTREIQQVPAIDKNWDAGLDLVRVLAALGRLHALGRWSFGVYLSHPLIMELMRATSWLPPENIFWGLPMYIASVCVFSGVLVGLLARTPVLRKVV